MKKPEKGIMQMFRGATRMILRMILMAGCVPPPNTDPNSTPSEQSSYQEIEPEIEEPVEELSRAERTLREMTLEEKVGQLFWIRPDSLDPALQPNQVINPSYYGRTGASQVMLEMMEKYPAGGIVFFEKNLTDSNGLKEYMDRLNSACRIPVLFAVDEEGGRIARIADTPSFGIEDTVPMGTVGKSRDFRQAYAAGEYIGSYLKELGFSLDFAPVADINTNPRNLAIGNRAFGEDPRLVSAMVSAFLDGLHSQGVAGCIKHFPGHGDTSKDTHYGYVSVMKTWDRLYDAELIPFIDNMDKADMIMIAHLTLPNITSDGLPASLSYELVTGKLRNELGYDGLIITDALAMGAIRQVYTSREACVLAFDSGVDVLLIPYNYRLAYEGVLEAVRTGEISRERLDESVLRILELKERYGLLE